MLIETCATCGFDGTQYDVRDSLGTLRALAPMWASTVEGVDPALLLARPAPTAWSAADRTGHSADLVEAMGRLLDGVGEAGDPVEPVHPDAADGFDAALGRLRAALAHLHRVAEGFGGERGPSWRRTVTVAGGEVDARWVVRHAIHESSHDLREIGRGLHALGAGPPQHVGSVAQLNVSSGGVPKLPVDHVEVGPLGVLGDRQANRKHHGRPLQALCLWSTEVIESLRSEGHPIAPGLAGENITVSGVDWSGLRPGVQLRIGTVLAEISAWATPCKKNAAWFADRDFNRMLHDRHPGTSRAYAWVRQPGRVETGDEVIVEP